ncbi:MAG: type I methionyl aminopeptidase [Myxococcota bacterium]
MAIVIQGPREVAALRRAGAAAAATLAAVASRVRAGISTAQIDAWVTEDTHARGGRPSQRGYQGFPASVCTSVNDVVCHGIPRDSVRLAPGDIVNVDVTTELDGMHGDTSRTLLVGAPPPNAVRVVEAARACLHAGLDAAGPGVRLGTVGAAIEACAESHGCAIVREYGGHGIGSRMHMAPHVAHHGRPGTGIRLRSGMALTIEPIVTLHPVALIHDDDGWTCRTADGSPSAQFEHTILITEDGIEVLTTAPADN